MASSGCRDEAARAPAPQTIRCAIIGGMVQTGFWAELSERYQRLTGHRVEVVAVGPKPRIIEAFRRGDIDLIAVHASDAMINLVADGLASDPQPWARNDFLLVGPTDDPAGIRGQPDALVALRQLIAAGAPVLIHASLGADGVLHDLLEAGKLHLAPAAVIAFTGERQQELLAVAAARGAYTLVGRIPFLTGKLAHEGLDIMVQGDERLRRPYLVAVARGEGDPARQAAARDLAEFLRAPTTQAWIAQFGQGRYDARPLFFPVVVATAVSAE